MLTPAEWRVLDAARHGLTRREIARGQGVSADAIRYHLRNITAKLGLPVLGLAHAFTAGQMAFFDVDGVRLYLHAVAEEDWHPGSIIYLAVADIAAAYHHLSARGAETAGAPHKVHTRPDGTEEWMAFIADGEGNTVGLLAHVPATSGGGADPED